MIKYITILFLVTSLTISESKINNTYEPKKPIKRIDTNKFLNAIFTVESKKNDSAYCQKEDAVGILQIRPVMIKEVNRIIGYRKYKLCDRWNKNKSIEIFWIYTNFYMNYYNEIKLNFEKVSRRWNGGPFGHKKQSTKRYWNEIKTYM